MAKGPGGREAPGTVWGEGAGWGGGSAPPHILRAVPHPGPSPTLPSPRTAPYPIPFIVKEYTHADLKMQIHDKQYIQCIHAV